MSGNREQRAYEDRAAPGDLDALRMLLNTDDRFHGVERFDDPDRLHPFLVHYGVLEEGETLTTAGAQALRDLRDRVRAFLIDASPATAAAVNDVAQRHPLVVRVEVGGSRLTPDAPGLVAGRVVARQLRALHGAMESGRWSRIGVCEREDCQWVYYDSSRNRSARWCSADPCGDVMKARAWRERQKSLAG